MQKILSKIYKNEEISIDDISSLLKTYFKIKKQVVKESEINNFINYLIKFNEIPFINNFHKFKTLNKIVVEDLIPTIENYLEVLKVFNKHNNLLFFKLNEKKYNEL